MQITNALNLPAPFVSLTESDEYPIAPNEYRVTSLLKGTRETILERRHGTEITRDTRTSTTTANRSSNRPLNAKSSCATS